MIGTHTHRTIDVPVHGGSLRVGIFEPAGATSETELPTILAIHGITSSHLAWLYLADALDGVRIIAPDLRGRGGSHTLEGPAGMTTHATDLIAVLDALGIDALPVVGHSMGGFVALVLAHMAPQRVSQLVLVDGGLPLAAPEGVSAEQLVEAILGPTAARLTKTFVSPEAYLDFWKQHPAFTDWNSTLDEYFTYDLRPVEGGFQPATSLEVTTEDTVDLNTGSAIIEALEWLRVAVVPVTFITVPRGLQNEVPGLYPPAHREALIAQLPHMRHLHLEDFNHYTVVMSDAGARVLAHELGGLAELQR